MPRRLVRKVSQFTSIFSSHQYLCYLIHCRGLKVLICKELTSYKRCVTGMAKSGSGSRMVFFSFFPQYWDKYVDPDGYHPCGFWTDFFGCPNLHTENVKSLLRYSLRPC